MAAGQENYNSNLKGMPNVETMAEALTAGIQNAFLFALIASIIGLVVSLFVKRV